MGRTKTRFVCQECGAQQPRWAGKCPECGAWNSFVEEYEAPASPRTSSAGPSPVAITDAGVQEPLRFSSGMAELDRVLGGGIVPGSLVLLGGEPGAGKSTLTTQVSYRLAQAGKKVLYVSGEESQAQIRLRARRLGAESPELYLLAETDADGIAQNIERMRPDWVVIDSIQAVYDGKLASPPGSIGQVREAAAQLMRLSKGLGAAICVVGHVTKEGTLAGPRMLEHMVDTVLYFEGDRFRSYRLLRTVKNRFGSTQEVGVFEMSSAGLLEVPDPSALFLSERAPDATGSAVAVPIEGSRPLLVEVQALVAPTPLASPRRAATGVDGARLVQILAVLERRVGLPLSKADVYVNVIGGLEIAEPAGDLAIALAIGSSMRDLPLPADLVAIGEVGLGGEVRSATQVDQRLREALKLGFTRALVPLGNAAALSDMPGLEIVPVGRLLDALTKAFPADVSVR
ncbi:MAG: DNA repair protein RadA [Cyanobacteria bacterium REEB65]|nr:DNA repair protein RadA [Cyanobacteria bacterium REEB65]